jgi:hypothetical protein
MPASFCAIDSLSPVILDIHQGQVRQFVVRENHVLHSDLPYEASSNSVKSPSKLEMAHKSAVSIQKADKKSDWILGALMRSARLGGRKRRISASTSLSGRVLSSIASPDSHTHSAPQYTHIWSRLSRKISISERKSLCVHLTSQSRH